MKQKNVIHRHSHAKIDKPQCSVCVANYNGEDFISECLDSIFAQTEVDFEVIVHDDNSTDNSVEIITSQYPNVELIISRENVGFCVSNNRMVQHARGEYILLLNNDATLSENALSAFIRSSKKDKQRILSLPQFDTFTHELIDRGCLLDPFFNPIPNQDPLVDEVAMAIGACLWVPRNIWLDIGGFPEWFESIGEDIYLCLNARINGYMTQVIDDACYYHRQGSSFGGSRVIKQQLLTTIKRRRLSERNKTYCMLIFYPRLLLWLVLPLHILLLLCEGLILSILKRDRNIFTKIYLNVLQELVHNWRMLVQQRKDVQCKRKISFNIFLKCFRFKPRKLTMLFRYGIPKIR